ncbi:MAG: hypothetical protein J6M02_05015 [Clostridia bacterium]|nr:hypothetical protein [Clostridia bacterium]
MLATQEKELKNTNEENVLTFYEKIKIKNNLESLFSHCSGSYVFIEVNPWKEEYIIRGKFHVKYGIFAKFEMRFDGIEKLRNYSEFIESLAFLKNACDEIISPLLNDKGVLTFLYSGEYVTEENINDILDKVKENKEIELKKIKDEISRLYEQIEETDNQIKDRKTQIKYMDIKIREVKDCAKNVFTAMRYLTFIKEDSIVNRIKRIFRKEQLKLNA